MDGEQEHEDGEGHHEQAFGPQLGQPRALEVEAPQEGHEVAGGDEVGHHLHALGHIPDLEHEAREQEGRQEGGHEGRLAGQELPLGQGADEDPQRQRTHQVDGRDAEEEEKAAPDGHLEEEASRQYRESAMSTMPMAK